MMTKYSARLHHAIYYPFMFVDHDGEVHWSSQKKEPASAPGILVMTSFPPRECGIATYSSDLMAALNSKFSESFDLSVCALETDAEQFQYPHPPGFILNTDCAEDFGAVVRAINQSVDIQVILVQHEFGLFANQESAMMRFWQSIKKPLVFVFHTVLPSPDGVLKIKVQALAALASRVIVMTDASAEILVEDYGLQRSSISTIPHGTHLVPHLDREFLKKKYGLLGKRVLTTFGLLNEGKSIETTIDALPLIVHQYPDVLFLVIGVTHPVVLKQQGERYRESLQEKIYELGLENHVRFINGYLPLPELLEYLQLTDIYLFTSKDRNQAVSGTMSYAIGCGCAVISTPIPHAVELLNNDVGVIVDFENPRMLAKAVDVLFQDEERRVRMGANGLHKMASTAWQNSALSHAFIFQALLKSHVKLKYSVPPLNLNHIDKLTTSAGMIQFSNINQPDLDSGFTLDDNARALIAMCLHYDLVQGSVGLCYIQVYFDFLKRCLQHDGSFLNYVDVNGDFTEQNQRENLEDSHGRAIWALGVVISLSDRLPDTIVVEALSMFQLAMPKTIHMHSPRAMAFVMKGLYHKNQFAPMDSDVVLVKMFADRLVQMFYHESGGHWRWFESYLTYGNSVLPEALLCAWKMTCETTYREIAKSTFDFLISIVFRGDALAVVSNQGWLHRGHPQIELRKGGEQPIDVAYLVMAFQQFVDEFKLPDYEIKMQCAFDWFLGANHLKQIMYNPCTGGCYDGLEDTHVNLNQGAESTVSYLMARLTFLGKFQSREEFELWKSLS